MRARVLASLLALALATPSPASAQPAPAKPSAADVDKARAHYAEAKKHQDAGRWDEAIKAWKAGYAIVPGKNVLFNLGLCYRGKGDKATAIDYFRQYLDAGGSGDTAAEAREYLDELTREVEKERAEAAARERERREAEAAEAERKRKEAEAAAAAEEQRRKEAEAAAAAEEQRRKEAEAAAERERERRRAVESKLAPDERPRNEPRTVKRGGAALRGVGVALIGGGIVASGLGVYFGQQAAKISEEVSDVTGAWTDELEARSAEGAQMDSRMKLSYGAGAVLLVGGGVLYGLGVRAETTVVITPQQAYVGVGGRF